MFKLMAKIFIKDYTDTSNALVRQKYGVLSGVTGIICNLILFVLKLFIGLLINSVAVISDAFNNLSDMGSTVVSIVGIKLSNKKPDRDHPFGHGRFEYISALIVSFIIMLVGFELLKTSVEKIITPAEAQDINWLLTAFLALSLPIKLFMYGYNNAFGKAIDSAPLKATAADSLNDCISTSAVIVATIIDGFHILPFAVDGFVGALVSLLIMFAGFSVAKDTVGLLLGTAPDKKTVNAIAKMLTDTEEIVGLHDLIVHDYGPGRLFASVHAEIPDNADIIAAHETIDKVEKQIFNELGCEISIHVDPISVNNPDLKAVKEQIDKVLAENNCPWNVHDLRMTDGFDNKNIIFDIIVPFEASTALTEEILKKLRQAITELDQKYSVVIQVDRDFINF